MARSLKSRAAFFTFISFLACLTSTTVICFSMAILDDAFIYAGIACLIGVVLLVAGYTGCRYACIDRSSTSSTGEENPSAADADDLDGLRRTEYRRLEREVEDLLAEVSQLQTTTLCNSDALDREQENLRTEYRQLTLWIEGAKVPEEGEFQAFVQRIDAISVNVQHIRRRSQRITTSLSRRPMTSVNLNLVIHDAIHPAMPQRPPPYEDSRRHARYYAHQPFTVSYARSTPPSYGSMSHFSLPPPSDDLEAPPPYDEAIGTAV